MTPRERLAALDRLQRSRLFKIIATAVIVVAGLGGYIAYVVARHAPEAVPTLGPVPEGLTLSPEEQAARTTIEATLRVFENVMRAEQDTTSVGIGVAVGVGLGALVIWLGLGLTYLALGALAALVGLGMRAAPGLRGYSPLLDRKSTRLNSSHSPISYAVFCLKKKTADLFSSGLSVTTASDVRMRPSLEAAFCKHVRTTFAGSIPPAVNISSNFSVFAL